MIEKKENYENLFCVVSDRQVTIYGELVDFYNKHTTSGKINTLSKSQMDCLDKDLELFGTERIKEAFRMAEESDFLSGRKFSEWSADFDWIIRPRNITSILNGKYNDFRYGPPKHKNPAPTENTVSSFDADEFLEAALKRSMSSLT